MNTKVRPILGELNRRLAGLYGERLRGVYLFGSYARDEANEDSDADVLIVLDRVDNYSREIDATSELTSELSLEYGISLSRDTAGGRRSGDRRRPCLLLHAAHRTASSA